MEPTVGPPLFCKGPSSGSSGLATVPFWVDEAVKPVLPPPMPLTPIRLPPRSVKTPAGLAASGPRGRARHVAGQDGVLHDDRAARPHEENAAARRGEIGVDRVVQQIPVRR